MNDPDNDSLQHWTETALAALGAPAPYRWHALPVEASHRRFHRVRYGGSGVSGSCVAMSSPPELERNDQFVTLAGVFRRHGIGVPELRAQDVARGFFLMSDLGDRHLEQAYRTGATESALTLALDTLIRLQAVADPAIPPYTAQRLRDELALFERWLVGAWLGRTLPTSLGAAFEVLVEAALEQPQCCVHRDYHCRNLLLDDAGSLGVVDFQDALVGPAAYDLASLLRDCYHVLDESEVRRWTDVYLARSPLPLDRARFPRQLDLTALQRQLKAVGIFARLHLRDGKPSHLRYIEPVLVRIGALARRYPELGTLADAIDDLLPSARARLARPSRAAP